MPGDVGLVAKLAETIFSWVTGEDGLKEFRNRREGDRLERVCNDTLAAWRANPSTENWRDYQYAVQALAQWSDRA